MIEQYVTPVPQESYHTFGLVSAVLGFFLLAYFFMYYSLHAATKVPIRAESSSSKSYSHSSLPQPSAAPFSSSVSVLAYTCDYHPLPHHYSYYWYYFYIPHIMGYHSQLIAYLQITWSLLAIKKQIYNHYSGSISKLWAVTNASLLILEEQPSETRLKVCFIWNLWFSRRALRRAISSLSSYISTAYYFSKAIRHYRSTSCIFMSP